MKDYGRVRSKICPSPKVVDDYSVWVNTDITEITVTSPENKETPTIFYEYSQVRYDKNDYISVIDDKNETLEKQVTDTQLALVEIYEKML